VAWNVDRADVMRQACVRPALVVAIVVLAAVGALAAPPAASAQADATGDWRILPYTTPINPIHVSLLRTGRVLLASGSENDPTHTDFRAAVWDPRTGSFTLQDVPWDLFCNAMSSLADGRILITGGNLQYNPFRGTKTTTIFDPAVEQFIQVQDMARGRWYPSNALLPDGTTMTFSGWLHTAGVPNDAVEVYDIGTGWSPELQAPFVPPLYPWLHLLPDGRVFFSGSTPDSHVFDPVRRTWTTNVAHTTYGQDRHYGHSVMLALRPEENYRTRIIIMGGNNPATSSAEIIDFGVTPLHWRALPPMSAPRIEGTAILLPDGKVLTLGGSVNDNDSSSASLDADLFDPASETWLPGGHSTIPRLYHSLGLLLPDATVWVAGSNPFQGAWENRMEIYAPPYLFTRDGSGNVVSAPRPSITGAPARVGYGATFQVQTPNAADIGSVVFVRPGSNTHAFDFEQRLVGLTFTAGSGVLTVTAPPNANVAPPGYYMIFVLNRTGVPSVAKFVQLSPTPSNQPPDGRITNPSADVTITAGQTVTFAGDGADPDGSIARYSWVFPGGSPGVSASPTPGAVRFSTPGTYIASLTVVDDRGENDPSPPMRTITVVPPDFTATISSPPDGATVNGAQTVAMDVSGGGTPSFTYTLAVDGTTVSTQTTTSASASYTWNTATVPDGSHTLSLTVTDTGNRTSTATRTVFVQNSGSALRVALTSPSPGDTVSGVSWVNVWVDGATGPFNYVLSVGGQTVVQQASSAAHVTLAWDTRGTPDGARTLTATVTTAQRTGSSSVNVTVSNGGGGSTPLSASITSPAADGTAVSGTTSVAMSVTGGRANYTLTLRIDGAIALNQTGPGTTATFAWDTTTYSNATHTLDLSVSDGGGQTATARRTVTVANGSSGSLGIALTSPSPGDTVSGTVWANIWVQAPYGTPPYSYTLTAAGSTVWSASSSDTHVTLPWETPRTPNGPQTLTVSVRDAANRTGSQGVAVVVQNAGGPAPLTAAFTSPADGATVSGTTTVAISASGGTTPYTYTLRVDGTQVFTQSTPNATASYAWNTTSVAGGSHTLSLTVTDAASRSATASRAVTVQNAASSVTATIKRPTAGSTVQGKVTVEMQVAGGQAPYRYSFRIDGAEVYTTTSSTTGRTYTWNTAAAADGPHTLAFSVTDNTGAGGSATATVTVKNGTGTPPPLTAAITSPGDGSAVSGTTTVSMSAGGGTTPYTYTLRIDGAQVFTQTTSATSVSTAWNTTAASNGSHSLSLTVTDAASRSATAAATVTVNNTSSGTVGLAVTTPQPGATVSGTVWVNIWLQTPMGTAPYVYTLSAAGSTVWTENSSSTHVTLPWVTTQTPNGAQTLTVAVRDAANRTGSNAIPVTVQNSGGQAGPVAASITSPAAGATVSATTTVAMGASGGTTPYTYTLRVDGMQVFTQATSAGTTSYGWNTTAAADGSHTLTLTVTDAGSQSATATRTVTVSNAASGALSLALTSPQPGDTVSGTAWANIWLQAPYGTPPYAFTLSAAGTTVWNESSSSTHVTLPWVTTQTPNGAQTLTVTVRDAAGRSGASSVNVVVQNP